jgi:hypothetical protein
MMAGTPNTAQRMNTAAQDRAPPWAAALILGLALASGCAREAPPAEAPRPIDEAASPQIDPVDRLLFLPEQRFGTSRAEARARLGPPLRTERRSYPNRHDPAREDTVYRLYYPGLELSIYRVSMDGREFLIHVAASAAGLLGTASVDVGSSLAKVHAVLGAPDEADARKLHYFCRECEGEHTLTVIVHEQQVSGLLWSYFLD